MWNRSGHVRNCRVVFADCGREFRPTGFHRFDERQKVPIALWVIFLPRPWSSQVYSHLEHHRPTSHRRLGQLQLRPRPKNGLRLKMKVADVGTSSITESASRLVC